MFNERQRKIEDQEASTLTVIGWSFLYKMSLISYVRIQFVIKSWRAKNEYAKILWSSKFIIGLNTMKALFICTLLCIAGVAQCASLPRFARNTEAIIPTLVEEILKVELQSDLKKNSAVEAVEDVPVIKSYMEEIIVEPVVAIKTEEPVVAIKTEEPATVVKTIETVAAPLEEKKPEVVEILTVQEVIAESEPIVKAIESVPEVVEKMEKVETVTTQEIAEKPVDATRTESVAPVEEPKIEIIKETIVLEPTTELRKELDVAAVLIKEEEIIKPMVRNVVKEEIPQVESLRNVLPEENSAVKEVIPEPVASLTIVEPVLEVEQVVKAIVAEPAPKEIIKEEVLAVTELKKVPESSPEVVPEIVVEMKPEIKAENLDAKLDTIPEIKEEKVEVIEPMTELKKETDLKASSSEVTKPEEEAIIKPIEALQTVETIEPEIRQADRPNLLQQAQEILTNVPVVGQIFNRNPAVADAVESVGDESATTSRPNPLQQVQQFISNPIQTLQNAINSLNPNAATSAEDGADVTTRAPGPIQQFLTQQFTNAQNAVNNVINRPSSSAVPTKDEEKPLKGEEKPVKEEVKPVKEEVKPVEEIIKPAEQTKTVQTESNVVVEPVATVQTEEAQKVVVEDKNNLVKNWDSEREGNLFQTNF